MVHAPRGARWPPRDRVSAAFFRAGHAHAGVLVILALVGQILADATVMGGAGSPRPQRHLAGGDSDAGWVLSLRDGAGRRCAEPPDLGGLRRRAVLGDWRGLARRRSADRLAPWQTVATHHVTTGPSLASVRAALGHKSLATRRCMWDLPGSRWIRNGGTTPSDRIIRRQRPADEVSAVCCRSRLEV